MMNNLRKTAAGLLMVLLVVTLWSVTGWSQNERLRPAAAADTSKAAPPDSSAVTKGMSSEEKLVRDVYARLMRYQSAAVDELLGQTGKSGAPSDYLTIELRNIRSGDIAEVLDRPLSELASTPADAVVNLQQIHLGNRNGVTHAYYEAAWAKPTANSKRSPATVRDVPGVERFDRYTSYQVTVSLQGKETTYRALAVHQLQKSGRPEGVQIFDNVVRNMNTVYGDQSPRVRSPWSQYVRTSLYVAVTATIKEARENGRPLIPADAPIGYLPGDEVSAGAIRDAQTVLAAASFCYLCSCSTPLSDGEWNFLHGQFGNLVRGQTCKLAPATATYNCLAWTIDDTSRWWWLEADGNGDNKITVAEMSAFYVSKGKSNIAYYGPSTSDVVHVAKKAGGNGPDCQATSKLGENIRMAHDLNQLAGGFYGNIVGGN